MPTAVNFSYNNSATNYGTIPRGTNNVHTTINILDVCVYCNKYGHNKYVSYVL